MDSIQQMSGKVKTLTDKLMAKVKYACCELRYSLHNINVDIYELLICLFVVVNCLLMYE